MDVFFEGIYNNLLYIYNIYYDTSTLWERELTSGEVSTKLFIKHLENKYDRLLSTDTHKKMSRIIKTCSWEEEAQLRKKILWQKALGLLNKIQLR